LDPENAPVLATIFTLAIGAVGAGFGHAIHAPAYLLTKPALLVSVLGLSGVPLVILQHMRDGAFFVLGVGIGATVTEEATSTLLRWPLAFLAMGVMLVVSMALSAWVLRRWFGFDGRSAVLAAAPGISVLRSAWVWNWGRCAPRHGRAIVAPIGC